MQHCRRDAAIGLGMAILTIALLQLRAAGYDQAANLAAGEAACRAAAEGGADIAVFPEMWNTGYTFARRVGRQSDRRPGPLAGAGGAPRRGLRAALRGARRRAPPGHRHHLHGGVARRAAQHRDGVRPAGAGGADLRQGPHLRLRRTRSQPDARRRVSRGRTGHRGRPGARRRDDLLRPGVPGEPVAS